MNRVFIENKVAVNILPVTLLPKLTKNDQDLIHTEVEMSIFVGGTIKAKRVLPIELTIGETIIMDAFFILDCKSQTNALSRQDWIDASLCVPSSLYQALWFWNIEEVQMVKADDRLFLEIVNAIAA